MITYKNVNIILILSLIVFILLKLVFNISFSYYWLLLLVLIWFIFTTIGSFHIRWNYYIDAKHKNERIAENAIAISFDDGPNREFTPKVLALLKEYKAKATFFCIGRNIEENSDLLQQIISEGHTVGNHSFSHSNFFGFFTLNRLVADIERSRLLVKRITNLNMIFFRPPFGVTNPNIRRAVKKLNLQTLGWSIRSYDTIGKNPDKVYNRITEDLKSGDVVLLHDTNELSTVVLERLLITLKKKNMEAITLDKLFKMDAYEV